MNWINSLRWLSALILIATLPALGAVQFFDYELSDYPVAKASCQQAADQLGKRLSDQTGFDIYQTSCTAESAYSSKIKLTYLADAALSVESTRDQFGGLLSAGSLYKNRATCVADLANQVDLFRKGTGLEPFVGYCYQSGEFRDETYNLRIEGFGDPSRHPYVAEATFYKGKSLEDTTVLSRQIFDGAKQQGVDIAFSAIVSAWPYYAVVLRYYSDVRINITATAPFTFDSIAGCTRGKAALEKIHQQALVQPLALFCTAWSGSTTEIVLNQIGLRSTGISQATTPDSFTDSTTCQQKLPAIETLYRETFKKNVIGTYCDGFKGVHRAHVFTKGKAAP